MMHSIKRISEFGSVTESDQYSVTLDQIKQLPIVKKISDLGWELMDLPKLWERSKNIRFVNNGIEKITGSPSDYPWRQLKASPYSYIGAYQNGSLRFLPRYGTPSKFFDGGELLSISDWEKNLERAYLYMIRNLMSWFNVNTSGFKNTYKNPDPEKAYEFFKDNVFSNFGEDNLEKMKKYQKILPLSLKNDEKIAEFIKTCEIIQRVKDRMFL